MAKKEVSVAKNELTEEQQELLRTPVQDIQELSIITKNSIIRELFSLVPLSHVLGYTEKEVSLFRSIGPKRLKEFVDFLAGHGLHLGMVVHEGEGKLFVAYERSDED